MEKVRRYYIDLGVLSYTSSKLWLSFRQQVQFRISSLLSANAIAYDYVMGVFGTNKKMFF